MNQTQLLKSQNYQKTIFIKDKRKYQNKVDKFMLNSLSVALNEKLTKLYIPTNQIQR